MTKEEKIKEAWGEYYLDVKEQLDEYGLVSEKFLTNNQCKTLNDDLSIEIYSPDEGYYFYRPNSLQGIETNNGWIKIESEEDLPKEVIECRTCFYNGKNYIEGVIKKRSPQELSRLKYINEITHYQPIEKLKPPIY